jgi:Cu2+-exporting ATPase
MSEAMDLSRFVTLDRDGAQRITLAVEGVHCAGCIRKVESAVRAIPGVQDARLNFTTRRLTVALKEAAQTPSAVLDRLGALGYRAYPFARPAEEEEARHARWLLRCLGVAGFAAMNVMLLSVSVWSGNITDITPETRDFFHWLSALIALPAAAYAGQPFFQSALKALRAKSLNMDVPISLGVLLALVMSVFETARHAEHAYFDSALMLLFFLLAGRYLDHAMRRKTRAAAGNLAALKAEVAHRLDGGEVVTVPAETLAPGDRVLVHPGERMPADGIVVSGRSQLDESLITGETARRTIGAEDQVFCGSLNFEGALVVRVTAAGQNTLMDEVERLLAAASETKSRHVRLADRAAQLYAPLVHVTAALTAAGWLIAGAGLHDSIVTAITVLIITCPCALALAVPAVQAVAVGSLFRAGVLVQRGDALERLAEVDTVVFDKTGTLTLPEPRVTNAREIAPDRLERAARLALASHHPLAMAVAREAIERRPYDHAVEEPGQGVRAVIDGVEARLGSAAYCGLDPPSGVVHADSYIAFRHGGETVAFRASQTLRPDAAAAIAGLRARGLEVQILSGDRPEAVAPLAGTLGIADWRGGLRPAEKIAALKALRAEGRKVLMVGDGINDAPALAAAHVSLSPISAADLAQAHADAVFLGDSLMPVPDSLKTAVKARRLMWQNLWLAALYNAVAVPIAIAGLATPLIAALAMSGSSILVTVNALRASRTARPKSRGERS